MKVSLVLATVNRLKEVEEFLNSLFIQTCKKFELIVVDQNRDGKLDDLISKYQKFFYIRHFKILELGQSIARNYGLNHVNNEIVGFPDDDCIYEKDVIASVIKRFTEYPEIDIVNAHNPNKKGIYRERLISVDEINNFKMSNIGATWRYFIKTKLLGEIGLFDERLGVPNFYGCGEDTDLIIRCAQKGAKIFFDPSIRVKHPLKFELDFNDFFIARYRGRGLGALLKKHKFRKVVVFRIILSPLFNIFVNFYSVRKIKFFWCTFVGRLEGYIKWGR
jgi:glycosyltransferase involved in cell wall biosynthesis